MNKTVKIPQAFYRDHIERDLPAPDIIRSSRSHFWINADSADLAELLDDAAYYADRHGPSEISLGLKSSARATVKAITQHIESNK